MKRKADIVSVIPSSGCSPAVLAGLFCLLFFSGGCSSGVMVIAHRGNSSYAPENTLASVAGAWQVNADAVEVDIHLTADRQIVVIHDGDTKRTSGREMVISESTYQQLRQLDVGSHKDWHFRNEPIPLLEDIVETVEANKKLFIEIKCDNTVIPYLKQVIEASSKKSRLAVISFNLDVLAEAKKQMHAVSMYWLVSAEKDESTGDCLPYDSSLIKKALAGGLDGLNLNYGVLTEDYVQQIHASGLEVYVWTVNYLPDAERMREFGVDGITTNYPADLLLAFKN